MVIFAPSLTLASVVVWKKKVLSPFLRVRACCKSFENGPEDRFSIIMCGDSGQSGGGNSERYTTVHKLPPATAEMH